jgi:hypothetical protein
MTRASGNARYSIQLLISDWLFIDGTMDNHVQSAVVSGEPDDLADEDDDGADDEAGAGDERLPPVARRGLGVRRAGWAQIPGWPRDAAGFETWPAPGQLATVTLTRRQWDLVIHALRHWAEVDESLSDFRTAAESRAVATAIQHRLDRSGPR